MMGRPILMIVLHGLVITLLSTDRCLAESDETELFRQAIRSGLQQPFPNGVARLFSLKERSGLFSNCTFTVPAPAMNKELIEVGSSVHNQQQVRHLIGLNGRFNFEGKCHYPLVGGKSYAGSASLTMALDCSLSGNGLKTARSEVCNKAECEIKTDLKSKKGSKAFSQAVSANLCLEWKIAVAAAVNKYNVEREVRDTDNFENMRKFGECLSSPKFALGEEAWKVSESQANREIRRYDFKLEDQVMMRCNIRIDIDVSLDCPATGDGLSTPRFETCPKPEQVAPGHWSAGRCSVAGRYPQEAQGPFYSFGRLYKDSQRQILSDALCGPFLDSATQEYERLSSADAETIRAFKNCLDSTSAKLPGGRDALSLRFGLTFPFKVATTNCFVGTMDVHLSLSCRGNGRDPCTKPKLDAKTNSWGPHTCTIKKLSVTKSPFNVLDSNSSWKLSSHNFKIMLEIILCKKFLEEAVMEENSRSRNH